MEALKIPVHRLAPGSTIYKRAKTEDPRGSVSPREISWFSETTDRYTYGKYLSTFTTLREIYLLDLRYKEARDLISEDLDPDTIYSGGGENMKFQKKIYDSFPRDCLVRGTYISRDEMNSEDEWYGGEEIVLWDSALCINLVSISEQSEIIEIIDLV